MDRLPYNSQWEPPEAETLLGLRRRLRQCKSCHPSCPPGQYQNIQTCVAYTCFQSGALKAVYRFQFPHSQSRYNLQCGVLQTSGSHSTSSLAAASSCGDHISRFALRLEKAHHSILRARKLQHDCLPSLCRDVTTCSVSLSTICSILETSGSRLRGHEVETQNNLKWTLSILQGSANMEARARV